MISSSSPRRLKFLFLLLLSGSLWNDGIVVVTSYPNGAGGCDSGPAVGYTHLTNDPIVQGSLDKQNATFHLDGVALQPGIDRSLLLENGTMYHMEVISNTSTMKGCLLRFSVPDGTSKDIMNVTPGINTQTASACNNTADAVGVTHTNATEKSSCACTLQVSAALQMTVDVTIVITNNENGSIFAYDQYVGGETPAPVVRAPSTLPPSGHDLVAPIPTKFTRPPAVAPSTSSADRIVSFRSSLLLLLSVALTITIVTLFF